MEDFGLYLIITNPILSPEKVAEIAVSKGVKMLQIRQKNMPDRELLDICCKITKITHGSNTKFIVNDRPDIAVLCGADGVHLGQDDLSLSEARRIVGNDMIIGLSTHSIIQAKKAISDGADYIGFGPVYPTPTKAIADPAVGVNLLKEVVSFSTVPVVAIGGIDIDTLNSVVLTGAKNICAVRYFMESEDLDNRIDCFRSLESSLL